jgi:hypothetical protein
VHHHIWRKALARFISAIHLNLILPAFSRPDLSSTCSRITCPQVPWVLPSAQKLPKSIFIACLFIPSAGGLDHYGGKRLLPGRRQATIVATQQRCPHFLWITLGIVFTHRDKTRRFCIKAS